MMIFFSKKLVFNRINSDLQFKLLVGTIDLAQGGNAYNVLNYIIHYKFTGKPIYHHNIALARVAGALELSKNVSPISLSVYEFPEDTELEMSTYYGVIYFSVGYNHIWSRRSIDL